MGGACNHSVGMKEMKGILQEFKKGRRTCSLDPICTRGLTGDSAGRTSSAGGGAAPGDMLLMCQAVLDPWARRSPHPEVNSRATQSAACGCMHGSSTPWKSR